MDKPILSSNFTMEDLYKLREYNSLRHKDMTTAELQADLRPSVNEFNQLIKKIRIAKGYLIEG